MPSPVDAAAVPAAPEVLVSARDVPAGISSDDFRFGHPRHGSVAERARAQRVERAPEVEPLEHLEKLSARSAAPHQVAVGNGGPHEEPLVSGEDDPLLRAGLRQRGPRHPSRCGRECRNPPGGDKTPTCPSAHRRRSIPSKGLRTHSGLLKCRRPRTPDKPPHFRRREVSGRNPQT